MFDKLRRMGPRLQMWAWSIFAALILLAVLVGFYYVDSQSELGGANERRLSITRAE